MFEDPSQHKMGSPTLMVQPLDVSQGPSPFHGDGPWLVYEVALKCAEFRVEAVLF